MSEENINLKVEESPDGPDRAPVKNWAKIRLRLGYLYFLLILLIAHPMYPFHYIGIYLITFGIIIRLAAASILVKDLELCTDGIYSLTRNPLYLGSAVIGLGFAFLSSTIWAFLCFFLILVPAYVHMIGLEEDYLSKLHPEKFRAYKFETPAFFPMRLSWADTSRKIDSHRLMQSKEPVSTAIFILMVIIVLALHRTWIV